MSTLKASAAALLAFLYPGAQAAAAPFSIFYDPAPQASSTTCQSYSLMLALAWENHPAFQLNTPAQLRSAELAFRSLVENLGAPSSHETWRSAVSTYTGGTFVLNLEYVDRAAWAGRAIQITGQNSANLPQSLLGIGLKSPILTSVERVGAQTYSSGHIVTVLAAEPQISSVPAKIGLLNSAFRGSSPTKYSCDLTDLQGDTIYHAGYLVTNDYALKTFGGKILVMWLSKS